MPVQGPTMGLPRTELPLTFYDCIQWDWSGSGSSRSYSFGYDQGRHALLVFTGGNQFHGTSVSGLNTDWRQIGVADAGGGAEAHGDIWLGNPRGFAPAGSLAVTYNGSNVNGIALARIGCPRARIVNATSGTVGSGTLTLGPVIAAAAGIAVALMGTQGGVTSIIADAGAGASSAWSPMSRSLVGIGTFPNWRPVKKGEAVSAAWVGLTNPTFGVLGVLAPPLVP